MNDKKHLDLTIDIGQGLIDIFVQTVIDYVVDNVVFPVLEMIEKGETYDEL